MPITREEATLVGLVGLAIGWVGSIFTGGKAYGKLSETVKVQGDENQAMKAQLKEMSSALTSMMTTTNGEPRFVSYKAHDKMQDNCHKIMDERHARTDNRLTGHDGKLDKLGDKMDKVIDIVSRLEERGEQMVRTRHDD